MSEWGPFLEMLWNHFRDETFTTRDALNEASGQECVLPEGTSRDKLGLMFSHRVDRRFRTTAGNDDVWLVRAPGKAHRGRAKWRVKRGAPKSGS